MRSSRFDNDGHIMTDTSKRCRSRRFDVSGSANGEPGLVHSGASLSTPQLYLEAAGTARLSQPPLALKRFILLFFQ